MSYSNHYERVEALSNLAVALKTIQDAESTSNASKELINTIHDEVKIIAHGQKWDLKQMEEEDK